MVNGIGIWTETASGSGSGVASAIHLGVPGQGAEQGGIDVVEDVILTHSTDARLEKGQGIAPAITGQGCVHLPKPAWLITQQVILH